MKGAVVVVAGPTGSGKSALALDLALRFGGEILNADAMQVYRGMDIGTAKLPPEERRGIPHHLLDVADPDEGFDAARYREMALPILESLAQRGVPAFLVGGTGLYIKALLEGLFLCREKDPGLRQSLHEAWEAGEAHALYRRLQEQDPPCAAKIHPHDRLRVLRALEVLELTGTPPSLLYRRHQESRREIPALRLRLEIERDRLYRRIDGRSEAMMKEGLMEETERLLAAGFDPDLKPMKAIGYRHAVGVLSGTMTPAEALEGLRRDTRRYAKRQVTWFGHAVGFRPVDPDRPGEWMKEVARALGDG